MNLIKKVLPIVLILPLVYSAQVYAVPFSITVDPPSISTSALPGSTVSKFITVQNTSDQAMSLKIYAEDWEYAQDGSKVFRALGSLKTSLSDNIKLFASSITLAPNASQNIYFTITSPKSGSGGYYSVIFFEGMPTSGSSKGISSNVKLVGRIGTIIYHEVEGTVIHQLSAKLNGISDSQSISLSLKNDGNVVEHNTINILIVTPDKKVIDRIALNGIKLIAGERRDVAVTPSIYLKRGTYSVITSFQTNSGPQFSTSELIIK